MNAPGGRTGDGPAPALAARLAAGGWPLREASREVQAEGLVWHVQVMGQGPALWLLHGTGAAGMSWRALAPRLATDWTVVVPDLPGHGFSGPAPPARRGLAGMARALAGLAGRLGLPPALVVGQSAGAAVAVQAVLDGHWRPAALLGVNAALQPLPGPLHALAQPLAGWLGGRGWAMGLLARRAAEADAVARLVASTGTPLDAEGRHWYGRLLSQPGHLAGVLAMWSDWDLPALWQALPRLDRPLELLVSDDDRIVPPRQAEAVCRHCPVARLRRRPDGGHLVHELHPDWVAGEIAGWRGAVTATTTGA